MSNVVRRVKATSTGRGRGSRGDPDRGNGVDSEPDGVAQLAEVDGLHAAPDARRVTRDA